uniref:E2F transcription factor CC-MB domain-containing protein n=1 Tax=Neogobius melanostomus TaxID=47308 RepID=A0A8C6UIR2_9GOBI
MRWVRQSIKNIYEDCSALSYVNQEDICNSFSGHTLLAVQAPSGTQLDVPIPKAIRDGPTTFQVHLKSSNGPINVMLLNKRSASAEAVALPVPPSKDVLHRAQLALGNLTDNQIRSLCYQASENPSHKNVRTLQTLFREMESNKTGMSGCKDLLDPSKAIPLSPLPLGDYRWDLDESEGICDLFDVPMLNV